MRDPKNLASKGRYGDTMLAHINPEEAALLKSRGGAGTINPKTGLPEFYGNWQIKYMEEQKKAEAEAAAAAAAAKKAAAPKYIPRSQRGQTGPQPAANYALNAANMDMVNKAYGNIGRASIGTNANQIDQGGYNYWMNQLNSGAISPQDFAANFAGAAQIVQPETANIYQNQALSQMRGARPSGEAQQFYQPAYQPQYNNYANPLTAGNVANYGTNPGPSSGYLAATAQGGQGLDNYYKSLQQFGAQQSSQPYGMDYATFNPARKQLGANQADLMNAYQYNPQQQFGGGSSFGGGGGNSLTPEIARNLMQRSMMGGVPTSEFAKYGGYDAVQSLYDASGGNYAKPTQVSTQPMQFNPYTNSPSYSGGMPQMQSPFSYQRPQQQMQSPFSYQQPMQQPIAQRTSSGPSQAIVGRSSQMRGTPNVMRRAKGGIASLLKKHK